MQRYFCMFVILLLLLWPASGQTAQDQARIEYTAAMRAVEQKQFAVALKKLESVMQVLGEQPELLTLAAESALALKDSAKASDYVKKAFAAADDKFRGTATFERLVNVAADLEVEKTASEGKWKRPYDSLCSMEFMPLTPTYSRKHRQYSRTERATDVNVWLHRMQSITKHAATTVSELVSSSDESFKVQPYPQPIRCDEGGVVVSSNLGFQVSGREFPSVIEPGVTSWQNDGNSTIGGWSTSCTTSTTEEVKVPAGTFTAVRVVCQSRTWRDTGDKSTESTETWYASGVGEVKGVKTIMRDDGRPHVIESELLEWTP